MKLSKTLTSVVPGLSPEMVVPSTLTIASSDGVSVKYPLPPG